MEGSVMMVWSYITVDEDQYISDIKNNGSRYMWRLREKRRMAWIDNVKKRWLSEAEVLNWKDWHLFCKTLSDRSSKSQSFDENILLTYNARSYMYFENVYLCNIWNLFFNIFNNL